MDDQKRKAINRDIQKSLQLRKMIFNQDIDENMQALIHDCSNSDLKLFIQEYELDEIIEGSDDLFIKKYETCHEDLNKLIEINDLQIKYKGNNKNKKEKPEILLYHYFDEIPITLNIKQIENQDKKRLIVYPFQYEMKIRFEEALNSLDSAKQELNQKENIEKRHDS
ncbi:hypothetical protein PPERSA_05405 [Pseudocohnilembus persalinus]|uniref:Uncharacterized protein n=1 Tax=Pseudocohnilembus persalinus TaxID=266149 RepID=A0A0V0R7W9_PSEPJ|nr:hypothetical protein PPERSA_05405 [Pseudocohnilembus persalinus]|eukprot:KRX10585.1 hypothetical protein PPERSA_05405 [Pseudocohnilembus persalinus]